MKPIILRTDSDLDIAGQYMPRLLEVAQVITTAHTDEAGLIEAAREASLILTCYTDITGPVIEAAKDLKGIVKYGVGTDAIDLVTATRNGVIVANCPAYGSDTVADHAFALLMALTRRLTEIDGLMKKDGWAWPTRDLLGLDLAGKTMGLIGLGRIGTAMARRCLGFGMELLACDPYVDDPKGLDVKFTGLDELLEQSDFVSVHCVLSDETLGMIGAAELARMRPHCLLINVSRGAIVDEAALIEALESGQIGGAGIDVFQAEPLPVDYPMLKMANVILTPHLAWYTREAFERVERQTLESILDILAGRIPRNLKNTGVLDVLGGDRQGRAASETSATFEPVRVDRIPCGHAVMRPGGGETLYIKAERQGTEYIHHYLVQIDPVPGDAQALIYIDPDDELIDCMARPTFGLVRTGAVSVPDVGHIFLNPKGVFLKVIEDPKSQKMFAFIDIETGDVRRRQERKVSDVHMEWRVESLIDPQGSSQATDDMRTTLKNLGRL